MDIRTERRTGLEAAGSQVPSPLPAPHSPTSPARSPRPAPPPRRRPEPPARASGATGTRLPAGRRAPPLGECRSPAPFLPYLLPPPPTPCSHLSPTQRSRWVSHRCLLTSPGLTPGSCRAQGPPQPRRPWRPCATPGFTYRRPGSVPSPSVRSPVSATLSPPTPSPWGEGPQGDRTPLLSLPCLTYPWWEPQWGSPWGWRRAGGTAGEGSLEAVAWGEGWVRRSER